MPWSTWTRAPRPARPRGSSGRPPRPSTGRPDRPAAAYRNSTRAPDRSSPWARATSRPRGAAAQMDVDDDPVDRRRTAGRRHSSSVVMGIGLGFWLRLAAPATIGARAHPPRHRPRHRPGAAPSSCRSRRPGTSSSSRGSSGGTTSPATPVLEKTFDVALHIGTLVGVVAYFRHDLVRLVAAGVPTPGVDRRPPRLAARWCRPCPRPSPVPCWPTSSRRRPARSG